MVYLLGINHSFQLRAVLPFREGGLENAGSAHIAAALEAHIGELVDKNRIRTVAEEYSAECLRGTLQVDAEAYLVAMKVCEEHGHLHHVFCDPDRAERESLYAAAGMSEAEDETLGFPIREGEWMRRLQSYLPLGNLVFLCGTNHVQSFSRLLIEASIESVIECEDFEAIYRANSS